MLNNITKFISLCKRKLFFNEYKKYYLDKIYSLYEHYEICPFCNHKLEIDIDNFTYIEARDYLYMCPDRVIIKKFADSLYFKSRNHTKYACKYAWCNFHKNIEKEEVKTIIYKPDKLTSNNLW